MVREVNPSSGNWFRGTTTQGSQCGRHFGEKNPRLQEGLLYTALVGEVL